MIKKDCFFYQLIEKEHYRPRQEKCRALIGLVCRKRKCSFYKTEEQVKADQEKYGKAI